VSRKNPGFQKTRAKIRLSVVVAKSSLYAKIPPAAVVVCLFLLAAPALAQSGSPQKSLPGETAFRVVASRPHDPTAFTQGLVHRDGVLYESAGLYGKSSLRKTDPATGKALLARKLPDRFFAEGITIMGPKVYLLTWKSRKGFIYARDTLEPRGSFSYSTEGWGLTDDGKNLIMSDGTDSLRFLSPRDFSTRKILKVKRKDGSPVPMLNELEYARGKIYCNVWGSDEIAVVNPESGLAERFVDLSGLRKRLSRPSRAEVLNGIAWKPSSNTFFVTGKYWSEVFEVELAPQNP